MPIPSFIRVMTSVPQEPSMFLTLLGPRIWGKYRLNVHKRSFHHLSRLGAMACCVVHQERHGG